jgi:hypothetical protein
VVGEFLGFVMLIAASVSVASRAEEGDGPAVVIGLGAFCFGVLAALDLRVLRLRRSMSSVKVSLDETSSMRSGVTIFYASRLYRLFRPVLLGTALFVAGYAVGGILGWVSPRSAALPDVAALTGGAVLCLLLAWAIWLVWVAVEIADGGLVRARLVLGPGGIYHRSHTFEHFVPWDAVDDVRADELGGLIIVVRAVPSDGTRVRRTARLRTQSEFRMIPLVVVRARSLVVDPAVAYHAMRYYGTHPEARAELLTVAAERRIRTGNLLD